ncbi:MAG: hypothetical protein ABEK01_02035 [Candidatus Nanohaloarchaea archaeon]
MEEVLEESGDIEEELEEVGEEDVRAVEGYGGSEFYMGLFSGLLSGSEGSDERPHDMYHGEDDDENWTVKDYYSEEGDQEDRKFNKEGSSHSDGV